MVTIADLHRWWRLDKHFHHPLKNWDDPRTSGPDVCPKCALVAALNIAEALAKENEQWRVAMKRLIEEGFIDNNMKARVYGRSNLS